MTAITKPAQYLHAICASAHAQHLPDDPDHEALLRSFRRMYIRWADETELTPRRAFLLSRQVQYAAEHGIFIPARFVDGAISATANDPDNPIHI